MRNLLLLLALACSTMTLAQKSQEVLSLTPVKTPTRSATAKAVATQGLHLDALDYAALRGRRPQALSMTLPFPELGMVELQLQQYCNLSDEFTVARSTADGTREEHYIPDLATYEVVSAKVNGVPSENAMGPVVLFKNFLQASIRLDGQQWEFGKGV